MKNWLKKLFSYLREGLTGMVTGKPRRNQKCETARQPAQPEGLRSTRLKDAKKKEEERGSASFERSKHVKFPADPKPVRGRTCPSCGGNLVHRILNYHCEDVTDVITPADRIDECLSCGGRSGLVIFEK